MMGFWSLVRASVLLGRFDMFNSADHHCNYCARASLVSDAFSSPTFVFIPSVVAKFLTIGARLCL